MEELFAVTVAVCLLVGCLGPSGAREERSRSLELDQTEPGASPFAGDGENCLSLVPEDNATLDNVEARASWDAESGPSRLWLGLHGVEGGVTYDEASGPPGLAAQAGGIDGKVKVVVLLADDADRPAENLTVDLSYSVEGPLSAAAPATCDV